MTMGGFRLGSVHADINPGSGPDLNLIVTFTPCEVTGDVNGGCGTSFISRGFGDADGNAEITFRVDVGASPSAVNLNVRCGHFRLWQQSTTSISVTATALDGAFNPCCE